MLSHYFFRALSGLGRRAPTFRWCAGGLLVVILMTSAHAADAEAVLPRPLASYADPAGASVLEVLRSRVQSEPFNLAASIIFLLAICHTFLTAKFRHWAHEAEAAHASRQAENER